MESIRYKGLVASVVPYSLLVNCEEWHKRILKHNRLLFVATMPCDLFNPYASFNTAIIILQKGTPHGGAKVFFARLSNDGFKLKKNNRIPQSGSQIENILLSYQAKTGIPKQTAFSSIDDYTKEWSPEAFIENTPVTDHEFISGFEQQIRLQSAFYISAGHRLLNTTNTGIEIASKIFDSNTKISLSGIQMAPFNISDYFSIQLGGKDEIEDLEDDGNIPIVSTSEFNNGVTAWKKAKIIYPPYAITVATDGSTCSSFVQEFSFYAFYKVAILRPIDKQLPIDALYYIAYLLKRERWRYVYARKFGKGRISTTSLYAPSKNNQPDFDAMAELTQQCSAYPIIKAFRMAHLQNNVYTYN